MRGEGKAPENQLTKGPVVGAAGLCSSSPMAPCTAARCLAAAGIGRERLPEPFLMRTAERPALVAEPSFATCLWFAPRHRATRDLKLVRTNARARRGLPAA